MFIGREKEIQHIYEAIEAYRHGRSAHLLYVGDHYVGKTALLRNVERILQADVDLVPLFFDFRFLVTTPEDFQIRFIERGVQMINHHIRTHAQQVAAFIPESFTQLYTHPDYADYFRGYGDLSRQGKLEQALKVVSRLVLSLGKKPVFLIDNLSEFLALENFPQIAHVDHIMEMSLFTQDSFSISMTRPSEFSWEAFEGSLFNVYNKEVLSLGALEEGDVLALQSSSDVSEEALRRMHDLASGNPLYFSIVRGFATQHQLDEIPKILEGELVGGGFLCVLCEKKYDYVLEKSRYYGPLKLLLRFLASREGFSQKEIGVLMGMKQGALRNYLVDLEKLGVVFRRGHAYFFTDQIFKNWLLLRDSQ